ncbi:methyl-accepting chemotaxis protein [Clostridium sp. JS66]|uniref:methyl-accepting chemotaxis protein n=1 Tax=Clostridium sp. JS66 TaxID=3064705 RepID=UPI00298E3FED|nr:methyl-accepting chemotaxis protein [Clostridium sp. JS66]WPC39274.1 methyl-accepting chemotaxis protein [Clostridium sp. JS66]
MENGSMAKKNSLKVKITASAVVVLLVAIAILTTIIFYVASNKLKSEVEQQGISLVKEITSEMETNKAMSNQIDTVLGDKMTSVGYLIGQNPSISDEYLKEIASKIGVQEIDIANAQGIITHSNMPANINFNYKDNANVQAILKGKQEKAVEAIRKSSYIGDGNYYKYGEVAIPGGGIAQIGIIANEIAKLNDSISEQNLVNRLLKGSNIVYAATMDKNAKVTAHSDKSKTGTILADTGSKSAIQEGKISSYVKSYNGHGVYDITIPLHSGENVAGAVQIGISLASQNAALRNIAIISLVVALLAVILGGFIIITIVSNNLKPLAKLAEVAEEAAKGDLTKSVEIKSQDEIGMVAASFNNMIENLRNINNKINNMSQNIAASSSNLLSSAQQAAEVSEEISSSTEEVADGAEKQVKATEEISISLKKAVDNMTSIRDQVKSVVEFSENTSNLASDGRDKMNSMVTQIGVIKDSVLYSSKVIIELQETSKQIGNIVELIDGIADQTNLLALNASIEAARAGEAGKGFAVVADEVRNLAEESMKSSNNIKELIAATQSKTEKALSSIEEGTKESIRGEEIVTVVGESLHEILKSFNDTKEYLEKVNLMVEESTNSINQVNENADEIQNISTNTAASTEEIAASTQEQSAALQEISRNVQDLSTLAGDLENSIKIFKL